MIAPKTSAAFIFAFELILVRCDWIEIPHITRNSHSYPEEHLETVFLQPKTTFATVATTATPKKIYPKETFSDVLERPPSSTAKNKKQSIQRRNDNIHSEVRNANRTHNSHKKEKFESNPPDVDDEYEEYEIEYEYEEEVEQENKPNTTESNSDNHLSGILPLLKTIQDTLIKTTQGNAANKIAFLQNLRDNLLYNLKDKIQSMWQPRTKRETSHPREHKDDYHMDSHEGPLITIGFLTFAVYLIKLVLQLLNALRANQSVILFPTTSTTTAANLIFGRRKRSEELTEKTSQVMNMINAFKKHEREDF